MDPVNAPVLLYDGVCGFCNGVVQFLLKRDKRGVLRFAPLQGGYAKQVMSRHPVLQRIDSIALVERAADGLERISVRSAAALRVAALLGGPWKLLLLAQVIPTPVRDFIYDFIARHRYRLFGKKESCILPSPEARNRFID